MEHAASEKTSVAVLLRELRIIALKTKHNDLLGWIDRELNGYAANDDLPTYRLLKGVESYGHFAGGFGARLENARIPPSALPEALRDKITTIRMAEGVAEYEQLLSSGEGELHSDWPADLIAAVGRNIYDDMACLGAWRIVPRGVFVRVLNAVRNRVLEIAGDIQMVDAAIVAGMPFVNETMYVDETRLVELRSVHSAAFDLTRLVRLCEEINTAWRVGSFHAVAMIVRAIMDHVPPIFAVQNFDQVANNYAGTRSFREAMLNLQNAARKISDAHLHTHIRSREVLPNATQVNFSAALDLLLSEIVRILK